MLRLEKSSDLQTITLSLRRREPFFEHTLLISLAIAASIHLAPLLLFHVHMSHYDKNMKFRAPITIDIDLGHSNTEGEGTSFYNLEVEKEFLSNNNHSLSPEPVNLQQMPKIKGQREDFIQCRLPSLPTFPSFETIEKTDFRVDSNPFKFDTAVSKVDIRISEGLADTEVVNPGYNPLTLKLPENKESLFLSYQIRVEEATGKVFWFRRENTSRIYSDYERVAENVLKNMQFAPNPQKESGAIASGTVEFSFQNGAP